MRFRNATINQDENMENMDIDQEKPPKSIMVLNYQWYGIKHSYHLLLVIKMILLMIKKISY